MAPSLADKLSVQDFVVLDGGLATELERRGCDLRHRLWSARLLSERPDAIRDVHLAYLRAGADCVTTAAYQASVPGFVRAGHAPAAAEQLYRSSVRLAFAARQTWCEERGVREDDRAAPVVAMSIGSFGAYLADGSEYRGRYAASRTEVRAFHRERLALAVDELWQWTEQPLLAFETVPSLDEAELLVELLAEHPGVTAWLSFSCAGSRRTAEGQPLAECARRLAGSPQLVAVGVNCTPARDVSALLEELASCEAPVIAYPNGGGDYDAVAKRWVGGDPEPGAVEFDDWLRRGARGIGGCCRTTPASIARLVAFRGQGRGRAPAG
ncbi:MAG: homocysteine S-methyltransferase [Planctomycetota bacterium]